MLSTHVNPLDPASNLLFRSLHDQACHRLGCAFRRIMTGFQRNLAKRHRQEKM